jgi:glucosamine-6-phosphate deaminase
MTVTPTRSAGPPAKNFQVDALEVRVHANQEELAREAARMAQACVQEALAARGSAAVILATGNSQLQFLTEWSGLGGTDWSQVTLFHMDEYVAIAAEHPASFRRYMRERVERRVRPRVFHYLEGDAAHPVDECERYADLLRAQPIDLCCLGVGENGHLAFNEPGAADFNDKRLVNIVRLDDGSRTQQVNEGHFAALNEVPQYALTLTIPALCSAARLLCIAPEERKARAVRDALRGPVGPACPASILRRQSHATLFLDADSSSLL